MGRIGRRFLTALALVVCLGFSQQALAVSYEDSLDDCSYPKMFDLMVLRPLGFDWQISIGVISSFAAREVIVSTLSVVYGLGEEGADDDSVGRLYDSMRQATHVDGTAVFTVPASISLLVFYILAMQCLPTQVVTRRETNTWKWPIFQFAYMTLLAYGVSLITYQTLSAVMT